MRIFSVAVLFIAVVMALFPPWMYSAWIRVTDPEPAPQEETSAKETGAKEAKEAKPAKSGEEDAGWRQIRVAATYHWFWNPPPPPLRWTTPKQVYWSVTLDYWRLGFEYGLLAAAAAWIMVSWGFEAEEE